MSTRDEFSLAVKRALAARVGNVCSRPECGAPTCGPQIEPSKSINVGVAAHITAAAEGGPRFDTSLTPEDRAAARNGIWLCQNCAKQIDNDPIRYSAGVLREWKSVAEDLALSRVGLANSREPRRLIVRFGVGELVLRGISRSRQFVFNVSNPHERPVTLVGAGIQAIEVPVSCPAFAPLLVVSTPRLALPVELTDGRSVAFMEDLDHFAAELRTQGVKPPVKIVGYVIDAIGNRHESDPVDFL